MNILIVGNGFDLSHYLPTKYDHFMDVMRAIEEKDIGKPISDVFTTSVDDLPQLIRKVLQLKVATSELTYQMNFKDLFSKCRDKKFIEKTREIYDTKNIVIPLEKILELQYKLKNNCWYQYFSDHVREVKTWIDFEQKIEHVLLIIGEKLFDCEMIDSENSYLEYFNGDNGIKAKVNNFDIKILDKFKLIVKDVRTRNMKPVSPKYSNNQPIHAPWWNINKEFCYGNKLENGFSASAFINYLMDQLEKFIEIFDRYLELVVSQLHLKCLFKIESECWKHPDKIFSFNYTNTFQRIHDSVKIEFLHGRHGEQQNIVLGISDLEDDALKKLKAYGFTKYHQKLFKDTDYLFLDSFKNKAILNKKEIEDFKSEHKGKIHIFETEFERLKKKQILNLNISIWGHSLDVSDKDYIIDLFSLNDDMDRNVHVTVYYFNKTAKFDLLNNLLAILGKDKVEQWMKNKWLVFKPNPEIKFAIENAENLDQVS